MAADFIQVNTAKPLGSLIVSIANDLLALKAKVTKAMGAVNHSNDGTTYTVEETVFGLPSGTGANFATLLGNLDNILNQASGAGGATGQAQINEFCGRLAGQ